jgi:hypothetical protein
MILRTSFHVGADGAPTLLTLSNPGVDHVAFKVKTNNPKVFAAKPALGLLAPGASIQVVISVNVSRRDPVSPHSDANPSSDKFAVYGMTGADINLCEDQIAALVRVRFCSSIRHSEVRKVRVSDETSFFGMSCHNMLAQWSDSHKEHKPTAGVHRYSTTTIPAIVVMPSMTSAQTSSLRQFALTEHDHQSGPGTPAGRRSSDQKRITATTLVASPRSPTAKPVTPAAGAFRATPVSPTPDQLVFSATSVHATLSELTARLQALDSKTQTVLVQRWARQLELPRYITVCVRVRVCVCVCVCVCV